MELTFSFVAPGKTWSKTEVVARGGGGGGVREGRGGEGEGKSAAIL